MTVRPFPVAARLARLSWLACCLVLATGCGPQRITLPSDAGSPLPNYSDIYAQVTASCSGVRTFTGEMGLRGRAGGRRLSGRLVVGFERPASMRLEAVAPFGAPGFILAARDDRAVLLLPRDDRMITGQSPGALLGALTGVSLGPADLQAILTGCVLPSSRPSGGRLHANGWASIDLDGGATMFLMRMGAWQVRAARRDGWIVEYLSWQGRFPQTIRLRDDGGPVDVDMTATLSQVQANIALDPAAFTVVVPESARPLTLDELRAAGPLGERR